MHQTRGHRFAAALAVTTLTVLGVAACDSADDEDPASSAPPAAALAWGPCPAAAPGTARDPRVTCAKVKVPLDYGRPDGKSIEVVISKLAATDPAKRHGVAAGSTPRQRRRLMGSPRPTPTSAHASSRNGPRRAPGSAHALTSVASRS